MKKSPLVVALALSALTLSGCGMFRSTKGWETAKQQSPLEIPPGLDTPTTTATLVIPEPGANNPTANGATARVNGIGGTITDGFVFNDTVDSAYKRVGDALEIGDIGKVISHDDDAHSYALSVVASASPTGPQKGFFSKIFSGSDDKKKDDADDVTAKPQPVTLTVSQSGQSAAEVRAQGDANAVARVIDTLKSRLGVK